MSELTHGVFGARKEHIPDPRCVDPLKLLDEAQATQRRLEHELSEAIKDRDDMALFQRVVQRRDRQIELLAAQAKERWDEINALREILRKLVDRDQCHYDHHGYCQTHSLDSKPCPHELAKAFL